MSKIRIVIIEDHDLTRLSICKTLLQKDYIEVVGEATNAHNGLIMLKKLQPDIVIVDIGLPDQNGIELTKEIKKTAVGGKRKPKVLILTSYDNKESVLAAFTAGADSYCMKDINCDNLLEAIRVTTNGHPWIDPIIASIVLEQAQQNTNIRDFTQSNPDIKPCILTDRELEVLKLIVEGFSNAGIAENLHIAVGTVKTHVRNIMNKLSADDRTHAAVLALRSGLVA